MLKRIASKNLHTWLGGYLRHSVKNIRPSSRRRHRHLIFTFCDHYEPLWNDASEQTGLDRVRYWLDHYPTMTKGFRDADGISPQHSFFYPGEQYTPALFDALEQLIRKGYGEMELHLHHDNATEPVLRAELDDYLSTYAARGHFTRSTDNRPRYAFIHGNWCLANSRPDGRLCGVNNEVPILFDTGCYADMTFPSAPDITQPNIVNQIYWPTGDLTRRRCYETGEPARVGKRMRDRILMVQGPLAPARRPGSLRVRIEASGITAVDPATPSRIKTWVAQNIHIQGREEWIFVKVYTHGAPEKQAASVLGEAGRAMHEELTTRYNDGIHWTLHYATARELVNIAWAAMDGHRGNPNDYRNYEMKPPPILDGVSRTH